MKRELLRDQKRQIFDPIFTTVRRLQGKEVNVLPYYDPKSMKKLWKTRGYFAQDIRRFMPPDIQLRSAQRCGTFLKTDELMIILGRGKNKKEFVGTKQKKRVNLKSFDELPNNKWPVQFKKMGTHRLLKKEAEGVESYAQILSNDEVFIYRSAEV